jgi:hypothetical protein
MSYGIHTSVMLPSGSGVCIATFSRAASYSILITSNVAVNAANLDGSPKQHTSNLEVAFNEFSSIPISTECRLLSLIPNLIDVFIVCSFYVKTPGPRLAQPEPPVKPFLDKT